MLDTSTYSIGLAPVNPVPLKGRYLCRSLKGLHEGAFVGADLYLANKVLVQPSLQQCADITGTAPCEVWWAVRRQEQRPEILAGALPLVPQRPKAKSTLPANGAASSLPTLSDVPLLPTINGVALDFKCLVAIAQSVDTETWLAAGTAAGLR